MPVDVSMLYNPQAKSIGINPSVKLKTGDFLLKELIQYAFCHVYNSFETQCKNTYIF